MADRTGVDWGHCVGLYGAMLATFVAIYNAVTKWKERRPEVRVQSYNEVTYYSWSASDDDSVKLAENELVLRAVNSGDRMVILSSMGFILPNKEKMEPVGVRRTPDFPHELSLESRCTARIDPREFAAQLKSKGFSGRLELVGFYEDEVGRTHKSKPFGFDIGRYV